MYNNTHNKITNKEASMKKWMDKELQSVKKNRGMGDKPQYRQNITIVALAWMLVVITFFMLGCAESSSSSSSGEITPPVIPTLASVSNVQIQAAGDDGMLSLRWQAPSDATHVVVTAISTVPSQSISVHVPAIEYRALFQQNRPYVLRGLLATTDYTVEIEAQKSDSGSDTEVSPKITRSVTTLSDETAPQDTFTQVAVEQASNGIKLTWDKALLSSGKTDIAEAIVQVIESTTRGVTEVSVQDVTQGEVSIAVPTIDGISYDVAVVYKDSNGNKSTAKQALRGIVPSALSQTVAPLSASDLTVTANDKSNSPADESLLIRWDDRNNRFDFSTGKNLQVRIIATATNTLIAEEIISNGSTAGLDSAAAQNKEYATVYVAKDGIALTKLYGTLTYKVEVYVSQNGKYSTAVSKEQATTDKSTEPVSNVSAVGGATSIVVGWQAPDVRDYAGVSIAVTEKNSSTAAKTVTITDRALRNTQITGLKANTEYTVAVVSMDRAGNKGTAENATVATADDSTAPDAVTNIQVSYLFISVTKVGVQITWTEPDGTKVNNKDIKEYSISIAEKGIDTTVVNEKKVAFPITLLSVEELKQGKSYTITILTLDYAGNKSTQATQDITTPQPTAPSEDLFQNRPALDTTGAVQIKATFKTAPGIGRYYILRMYDSTTLVSEKSTTGGTKDIIFGIADGVEVPKSQANTKNYRFTFLIIANNIVSPITTLADTVAVYDSTSTAPPAPKDAILSVKSEKKTTATAIYMFNAGDITDTNKAPNGSKLKQTQIQYKVYIAEGDHSKKTLDAIKALAGVQTRDIAGDSALQVRFIGKKDTSYTAGVEAINSLNPSYSIAGSSATIKTVTLTTPSTAPKELTYISNNAVVFAVPTAGSNSGKKVITVQVNASAIAGVSKVDGNALEATDLAYYVLYLKKEYINQKPAGVSALWAVGKSCGKVAKYTKATGVANQAIIQIPIVDSTSAGNAGATPIETAKDYYIGVRVVNTTSPNYDASNIDKLFPTGFYTDVAEIKEVYTSNAVAPDQSLLAGKLVVSQSTSTTGTIKLALTELSTFTGAKNYDGTNITASNQLVYTVYGLQQDTTPTVAEVLAGRKVNIGSATSGVYTVPALASLGLSLDTDPIIAIKGATKYHFVVKVAIKTDPSKKVASSSVASVTTASQATAPTEVRSIQTRVAQTGMKVFWAVPSLSASRKTDTGDTLTAAQVSYKIYKVAKSGDIQRTVTQIKNADSSPTTIAVGTTSTTLTGLTNRKIYEIVVQAVNSTDDTKISAGQRHEFEARTVIIENTMVVSAEVGNKQAINTTRILTSSVSFTCDATILEADAKRIKEETGLAVSFSKNTNTVTVTGIANKSNIHDIAITEYSYNVVQCSVGSSKIPATIIIKTVLKAAPSGKAEAYYRPITKAKLQTIISEEKTRQGSGGNNNPSPDLNMIDTSAITSMNSLFNRDSTFNGDITQWNTSNVEDMQSMFKSTNNFNQDIGNWDVGKVTNMFSMFDSATAFNQDIGNWNMSNVKNTNTMFKGTDAFNQDIGNWDVGNVERNFAMFYNASKFDQNLSSWKMCKGTISSIMFDNSAMAGKTSKYPKGKGDPACTS